MTAIDYYRARHGWRDADFPNAVLADRCALALPLFPGMSAAQQETVAAAINDMPALSAA